MMQLSAIPKVMQKSKIAALTDCVPVGLSYTTFSYEPSASSTNFSLAPLRDLLEATAQAGRTFPSSDTLRAATPLVSYDVKVTNTGTVDSDDVVLGFLSAPGAGQNGVPSQTLFGFERIHVKAGESMTVNLYPEMTDFANTMLDGTKLPAVGEWTVRFGVQETAVHGQGYAEMKFSTH